MTAGPDVKRAPKLGSTSAAADQGLERSPSLSAVPAAPGMEALLGAGLLALLTILPFWPTLVTLDVTWARYNYSHGWLATGLAAWVLWTGRKDLAAARRGFLALAVPVAGLSLFWLASTVMHIQLFHQTAFVLLMVGWGLLTFGRSGTPTILMAGLLILLSVPVWEVLLPLLRSVATLMSGLIATVLQVPADIEGNFIHLPSGTLEVGNDCAGLNYLLSSLTIGLVYAWTLVRERRKQVLVVVLAAATAVVGNWIRIAALAVVAHLSEMQAWLVANHIEFGWVIYALSLVVFFLAAPRIGRSKPGTDRAGPSSKEEAVGPTVDGPSAGRGVFGRAAMASLLVVMGPAVYHAVRALPAADVETAELAELARGEGWAPAPAGEAELAWQPDYRNAQQHERMAFTDGTARVFVDRFVYERQGPNAKLVGWPNRIAPDRDVADERVVGPVDSGQRLWVRQAVVRSEEEGLLVSWYWYRVGGVSTWTGAHAKALELPAFAMRRRSSELLALTAPCRDDDCEAAVRALMSFSGIEAPSAEPQASAGT